MSNNANEYKGSTIKQLILVIPGAILAFTLLISLIAKTSSVVGTPEAEVPQAVVAQLEENIKPVASVEVAAADAGPHVDKSGEEVVKAVCSMCHAAGLMNAPKIGDKGQWAPRIAQGYDTLISHAINGIRSMPARGGNATLTDGEIANAVANMANQAGANFTPPAPKAAAPADAKVVEADPAPADAKAAVAEVATAAVVASPAKK
jgi:cytochrome c5